MVAKFQTQSNAPASSGSNTLLYVGIAIVGAYLLYRFVIKPQMDKSKAEADKGAEVKK